MRREVRHRSVEKRFGLGLVALVVVEPGKVVQDPGHIGDGHVLLLYNSPRRQWTRLGPRPR